ncbi:hypothetical protein WJX72_008057 [[Myrmecia] bisecta]|uniref:Chlorophyll a-b binding protein, chloroplastic n=1 Tax=[Myrmecia] bisecta TaxID=41462 RepID=A0AAW1QFS2_9CHLO
MAAAMGSALLARPMLGRPVVSSRPAVAARAPMVVRAATEEKLFFPGAVAPEYLDKDAPGYYGFDPLGLASDPKALAWYKQAELVHCRWAMLGAAGVLGQEIIKPDVWFYNAGLPENAAAVDSTAGGANLAALLGVEFLLMHWVEVRRWQDIRNHGSVNEDPIFKGNKVPNEEPGYPGGIFDPFNFSKGNLKEMQTKEIKNGRLAMVAFMGFIVAAQATGKNPIANLLAHVSNPFGNNIATNIGTCHVPHSVNVQGLDIPLICLWPGQQL